MIPIHFHSMIGNLHQKSTATRFGPALTGTFDSLAFLLGVVFVHACVFPVAWSDGAAALVLWPLFEFWVHKVAHEYPIDWHIQHHLTPFEAKLTHPSSLEFSAFVGWLFGWLVGVRWFQLGAAWYGVTHAMIHEGLIRNSRLFQHHRTHHACGASKYSVVAPILDYVYDACTRAE